MTEKSMKYFLKTMGCQMNMADSEIISNHMRLCGIKPAESFKEADIIIMNTCTVRAMAEHKALSFLGEVKKRTVNKMVIVAGCAAEQWGESIKKRYPMIKLVAGAKDIEHFPVLFDKAFGFKNHSPFTIHHSPDVSALVTIMRGCENFCSYCIVPYVRGKEISKPWKDIIKEITALVKNGRKEIMLLGQNVNSYKADNRLKVKDFSDLLVEINKIKGLERIRFMTSHPKDLSDKLIKAMANLDKVCNHIHLPLQSGSDKILKKMNRGYTSKEYLTLIHKLRKSIPDISITTDILVGFPTETDIDFNKTIKLIKQADFDFLFAFKYSPREGTKSSKMKDSVSQSAKEARLAKVLEISNGISTGKNAKLVGTKQDVLVEEKRDLLYVGSTGSNKKVFFKASKVKPGMIVNVKITDSKINSLIGIKN